MSNLRLVTRGEGEPAATGCSGASELRLLPRRGVVLGFGGGFIAPPSLSGFCWVFLAQGLQCQGLLVAALKVGIGGHPPIMRSPEGKLRHRVQREQPGPTLQGPGIGQTPRAVSAGDAEATGLLTWVLVSPCSVCAGA